MCPSGQLSLLFIMSCPPTACWAASELPSESAPVAFTAALPHLLELPGEDLLPEQPPPACLVASLLPGPQPFSPS